MTLVKKRTVFGGKIETTPGTKETLTATEAAYNVYDLEIFADVPMDQRNAQGLFGQQRAIPGGQKGKATFKIDLAYDGTNIPTWADLVFPSCGLVKASRVFKPKTQSPDASGATVKTATIGKWTDGKFSCIYGAMGTFKVTFPTSKIVTLEFEYEGVFDAESDDATPAPTYPTDAKLKAAGGPATFDSVNLCMETMTLDVANKLYVKQCSNTTKGYEYTVITDRNPKMTGNPESVLVASQARNALFIAGTEKALRYVVPAAGYNSGTGAKSIEFLCSQAQIMEFKEGNREDVAIDDITFQLNQSATVDSDFSITFNA